MSSIKWLGIYTETIENEMEKCHDLLDDFSIALDKLDIPNELHSNSRNLEDMTLDRLEEYIDVQDMTNSIVSALHDSTIDSLKDVDFENLGITFENYVNGDDSHLYINVGNECYEYPNWAAEDILQEAVIKKEPCFYQQYSDDKYLMGEIAKFWQEADFDEVADFYTDGIIPDKLDFYIDANTKVHGLKDSIPKKLIARFDSNRIFEENLTKTIYEALPEYCEDKCIHLNSGRNSLYDDNAFYLEHLKDVMNHDAEISSEVQKGVKNKYCVKNGKIQETKNNKFLEDI